MAKVVNRSQQVVTAGVYPRSAYSRLLMFRMVCTRVGAMRDGGVTPVVGQKVWILGVDIWFMPMEPPGVILLENNLMYGGNVETDLDLIRDDWTPIMRFSRPGTNSFFYYGQGGHMRFDMNMLIVGMPWRFGLVSQIIGAGVECFVTVGFHICEG